MSASIQIQSDVHLERLLSTNPAMRAALDNAVREILWVARGKASQGVKKYIKRNEHETYRAIRNSVYKKVIGGNLNILPLKRALRMGHVSPSRRGRTKKTEQILSYTGVDRTFVLRFISDTTKERWTTNMDGHPMYRKSTSERPKGREYRYPNMLGGRGGAAKRNGNTVGIFEKEADQAMESAAVQLQQLIDNIIAENF